MLHEPVHEQGVDRAAPYKTRIGVYMFLAYALFYGGFVVINTFSPGTMEIVIVFGLNLAVAYGFALIIVALILALVYNHMCIKRETAVNHGAAEEGDQWR